MTDAMTLTSRVLPAHAGADSLETDGIRFVVDSPETGGRFALMELFLAPRALGAPLHRHRREDEFTYVTRGRITALLGDEELTAGPGDLIVKPRGQWHTFWNAGDEPAAALEIDSPGGLEQMFQELIAAGEELAPAALVEAAARYGCEVDLEGTADLVARHGLDFWW